VSEPTREDLDRAVATVVNDCLGVQPGEEVLVIANPATLGLGERLRGEAGRAGGDAVLTLMAERASHAAEPPDTVAGAMRAADVVLAPTVQSLPHPAARKAASEAGARIATLPGVTEEMLARVMSADMTELRRRGHALAAILDAGAEARITCANGSDLRLGLTGRAAIPDAGELTAPGAFGNLPCGEGFISPDDRASAGRLVVDGTIAGVGIPAEPVTMEVEDGRLVSTDGPEGAALLELLTVHGDEGATIAELGVGTNEKAELTGNVLEDEKLLGTVHVAFGASAAIGGRIQVPVHLDCVVMRPTLTVDGTEVVRDGERLV
jgi:leucyl aminopeptidase (aminopeptidase T)